eukprot:TRINITY_DN5482_c0_g2_i1.p1 TRINITY_DN5482_c0_g2~~TRINITY_DN5482_c0_g2_i1.p1  ORF type:complete len:405 (+),score=187.27 TRINITY_DN5482_c0_g2_i1:78-1292(+)
MSAEFLETISAAQSLDTAPAKSEALVLLLDDAVSRSSSQDVCALLDAVCAESSPLAVSRDVLAAFAKTVSKRGDNEAKNELLKEAAHHALDAAEGRAVAFEEQLTAVREALADLYQADEAFSDAARVLTAIPLDSGQRMLDPKYKVSINVRIARLFLEDEDSVEAERYLNRASDLIHLTHDAPLLLAYRAAFVQVLDFKRQFLKAALKYHQMSQEPLLNEEGQMQALDAAHKCAILSEAGPARQRLLATLFKDERSAATESYLVLKKVYLDRILGPKEIELFAKTLRVHQLARLADNSTVLERAVVEHNVLAASRVYTAVSGAELGRLLDIDEAQAVKVAAKMVAEGRLDAQIDQVASVVSFRAGDDGALVGWDDRVRAVCEGVNSVLAGVAARDPDGYATLVE